MVNNKIKISELAKDFDMQSKDICAALSAMGKTYKPSQSVSTGEVGMLFDYLTQKHQVGSLEEVRATAAQAAVTDMTNELLTKNAETLKTATVETARQMERGVVDIETLEHTNELLLSTIDEVVQIQEEGRQKRETAEAALMKMENELKQKLMEINQ